MDLDAPEIVAFARLETIHPLLFSPFFSSYRLLFKFQLHFLSIARLYDRDSSAMKFLNQITYSHNLDCNIVYIFNKPATMFILIFLVILINFVYI